MFLEVIRKEIIKGWDKELKSILYLIKRSKTKPRVDIYFGFQLKLLLQEDVRQNT